jgi:hypothetical protein
MFIPVAKPLHKLGMYSALSQGRYLARVTVTEKIQPSISIVEEDT